MTEKIRHALKCIFLELLQVTNVEGTSFLPKISKTQAPLSVVDVSFPIE